MGRSDELLARFFVERGHWRMGVEQLDLESIVGKRLLLHHHVFVSVDGDKLLAKDLDLGLLLIGLTFETLQLLNLALEFLDILRGHQHAVVPQPLVRLVHE